MTEGSSYLQTVSMEKLTTMMYEYPDSSINGSALTAYDPIGLGQSRLDQSMSNAGSSYMSFR